MLKQLLFKIAKGPSMGKVVGKAFQHCGWAIPVKKVYSGKDVIAFRHPKPSYENHIIISPKKAVRNLQKMATDSGYFAKIWDAAKQICATHPEYGDSFVLVANGGKRQEVQQVHFHMFTGSEVVNEYSGQAETIFYSDESICVSEHPDPNWEIHFVTQPDLTQRDDEYIHGYFKGVLRSIDLLDAKFDIVRNGYSLVYQHRKFDECPTFHIISGKRLK